MADTMAVALISAFSGLVGVTLGAWMTQHRDTKERQLRFIKQQVEEFYAPMVGIRSEIRSKGEVRLMISQAANDAWADRCKDLPAGPTPAWREDPDFTKFEKLIKYNNDQLKKETVPAYRRMLELFRDKMWLAEASTRGHYVLLVNFVEIWNRALDDSLPGDVIQRLAHDEQRLYPLYDDLEEHMTRLTSRLRAGG